MYYSAYQDDINKIITIPFLLYVDDLVIYIAGQDLDVMMKIIFDQANAVQKWYDDNNLSINYTKTKFQIFCKPNCVIPPEFTSPILLNNGQSIEYVHTFKYLGVMLDSNLNFRDHFNAVTKKVSQSLGYLHGLKRHLTDKVMAIMINSHIHSIMDFCIDIWAIQTDAQLDSIQHKVNSFLVKFMFPSLAKKFRHKKHSRFKINKQAIKINELLCKCNLLTIRERRDLFLYKYAFKHLQDQISSSAIRRSWPLLTVTSCNFAQKSINYRATKLWNKLPRDWDPNLSYNKYVQAVREHIINARDDQYCY